MALSVRDAVTKWLLARELQLKVDIKYGHEVSLETALYKNYLKHHRGNRICHESSS